MKTKLDKIIDWLSAVLEKDVRRSHREWVSYPNTRSFKLWRCWLEDKIRIAKEKGEECPYNLYSGDLQLWKENNFHLFVSSYSSQVNESIKEAAGLNTRAAANYTVSICLESVKELRERKNKATDEDKYLKISLVLEKWVKRLTAALEIQRIFEESDRKEIQLNLAHSAAFHANAAAKADPNATPQMREWHEDMLMIGLSKVDPMQDSGISQYFEN